VSDAFYRLLADGSFESSPATAGPWGPDSQHGGPPSALLARAFERCDPVPGQRLARLTVEFLRPVPIAPLTMQARVVRPGRRVTLLEGAVVAGGEPVLLARGWRIGTPSELGPEVGATGAVPDLPSASSTDAWPGAYLGGYMSAIEWRVVRGALSEPGPGVVWARQRPALVEGEQVSPFCRAAIVADSGSGVSASVDLGRWLSINIDLTLTIYRAPVGDWILLDAATALDPGGAGLADTRLADWRGAFGRVQQTMVLDARQH